MKIFVPSLEYPIGREVRRSSDSFALIPTNTYYPSNRLSLGVVGAASASSVDAKEPLMVELGLDRSRDTRLRLSSISNVSIPPRLYRTGGRVGCAKGLTYEPDI